MYTEEDVRTLCERPPYGDVRELRASIGQGDGGSVESQNRAALDFWQKAVALDPPALSPGLIEWAQVEIARLTLALTPPEVAPLRRFRIAPV